jgi:hypothetical protein
MENNLSVSITVTPFRQVRPPHELQQMEQAFVLFLCLYLVFYRSSLVIWYCNIQGLNPSLGTEFRHDIVLYKTRNTIAHPSIKVTKADSKTDVRGGGIFLEDSTENRRVNHECNGEDRLSDLTQSLQIAILFPEVEYSPNCADEDATTPKQPSLAGE